MKPRIAHLAGPTATIQNTPPLVTSNKARQRYGLPPRLDGDGEALKFDALRAQRLAAPVKVYVEQFSAHPLERDAQDLYAPPDGYLAPDGSFSPKQRHADDTPVYEIELLPQDGLYPLPYMARQADGASWEEECAFPGAPAAKARQGFFPDGSRSFEEIDRFGIGVDGAASVLSSLADIDFYRVLPPGGFKNGLPQKSRGDRGDGDIARESMGRDFFPYKPYHLGSAPPRPALAGVTNKVQKILASVDYDGAIWTQGSPNVEEAAYWFNLLIDSSKPIVCNSAQRPQGQISNDGPHNILDSVRYIRSRAWADANGADRLGVIVLQEQQFFAAREVAKGDARPGGYIATGGHGGILGQISHHGSIAVQYLPAYCFKQNSQVRLSLLPDAVRGVRKRDGSIELFDVPVRNAEGELLEGAIPSVSIIKDGGFSAIDWGDNPELEGDLRALIDHKLSLGLLAGFVIEGLVPYGNMTSAARQKLIMQAVFSGLVVARVGRGAPEGFADPHPLMIAGSNLTSTKARLLLMACLMKFGALPIAADPLHPTDAERQATIAVVSQYQQVFETH